MFKKLEKIFESIQTQEERNNFNFIFLYIMNATKKEDKIIELIQKNITKPLNKQFMTLYESAIETGEQIGIQKKEIEVVLKSFDNGISIPLISNITNLSEEEVMEILREHGKIQ